jgi:membrane-associated protein
MGSIIQNPKIIIDFFLHLDKYLGELITKYGVWTYAILFLIIFMETGFVVTPFLPGDSLLFAAGTFAGLGYFNVYLLFGLLFIAAVLGDTVNYWIGHKMGPKVFKQDSRFIKEEYLERTQDFYKKHGGKTIVLARFIPIIRTFAPFVAGVGTMSYPRFFAFNVFGGFIWTAIFIFGGYFFGNIEIVRNNFELVIIVIIILSVLPMLYEFVKNKIRKRGGSVNISS